MVEPHVHTVDEEPVRLLPDVSSLPLEAIFLEDDSALGRSVRRVLEDLRQWDERYAAHGSSA
ncbi:FXSXX-COOH protein [Krasilnikovia cinnamomea]|uniref:FXSXX-COOH protein n=1 Tax=Krasilnikovia cinnamomea TaxID=349313 RepID=A0A4Q7ZMV5_9ACTN|nr:hypothetical protein [Krasilnikovia cinnamomea]RZU52347.1 FXSXX-COOH protein [Krasilnikovia cinnamomea]